MSVTAVESRHHDNSDVTPGIKWEDSGIVIGRGLSTPESETKLLISSVDGLQPQQPQDTYDNYDDDDVKRRSSAGTYSLSSDSQPDCANNTTAVATAAAWLSDVDDGNSAAQQRVDAAVMSDCGDDRPSVGSSPEQTESASPEQTQHKPPQLPKVDYTKGIRCNDVLKAVEILLTSYRLPDVVYRQCHRHWSSWANTVGGSAGRGARSGRHSDVYAESSQQLRQVCVQIERRHLEIFEILRKLLELDAANKAEADALVRLSDDPATSPRAATADRLQHGHPGSSQSGKAAAPDATTPFDCGDGPEAGARAGVKRRNPFSRAVSAIRKKFARPQSDGVPVAA